MLRKCPIRHILVRCSTDHIHIIILRHHLKPIRTRVAQTHTQNANENTLNRTSHFCARPTVALRASVPLNFTGQLAYSVEAEGCRWETPRARAHACCSVVRAYIMQYGSGFGIVLIVSGKRSPGEPPMPPQSPVLRTWCVCACVCVYGQSNYARTRAHTNNRLLTHTQNNNNHTRDCGCAISKPTRARAYLELSACALCVWRIFYCLAVFDCCAGKTQCLCVYGVCVSIFSLSFWGRRCGATTNKQLCWGPCEPMTYAKASVFACFFLNVFYLRAIL